MTVAEKTAVALDLKINRELLLKPLQLITSAIDKKQTLPILSHILFQIKDGLLTLTGTDLEIELIKSVALEAKAGEVSLAIPAKKLFDICRALPTNAEIRMIQKANQLRIQSGKSRFVLSLLPSMDFPTIERASNPEFSFAIEPSALQLLFLKTSFSMAQQDVRYFLNGLLLDMSGSSCTAVTTDGHRLSAGTQDAGFKISKRHQVLIPRKAVLELIKLLDDVNEAVDIDVGENYVSLRAPDFVFTSKLIDGRFPEYRSLIPKKSDKIAKVDKMVLKDALSRVAILSNEKYRGAWFNFESGKLVLQANNPDKDEAEEEVSIDYDGESLRLGCNINYILDVIHVLEGDTVILKLTDTSSSMLIEDENSQDNQYVVMPMCL